MLLAIDIGNTQTVLGIYDGEKLLHMWRVVSRIGDTSDELRIRLRALLGADKLCDADIEGAVIASVVPALTHNWEKVCERTFGVEPLVVTSAKCSHLLNVEKGTFAELGADRIADAFAALKIYGAPSIVVDLGTATNIEIVGEDGVFKGGIIAPGVESSMKSLLTSASLLRAVELEDPGVVLGTNTTEAIQIGFVVGEGARIDGLVERVEEALGYEIHNVIATGGLSHRIAPLSRKINEVNLELTLEGLRLIYNELA